MSIEEALRLIENLKWLKGYDNTTIGEKTVAQILNDIAKLLKEQQEEIKSMKATKF